MKIEFDRDLISKAVQQVGAIVEKKTTMPILSNILLEAKGSKLILSATDLEITIQCECPVKVTAEGKVCIPARSLVDLIRELPERTGKLRKGDNEWMILESGKAHFKVVGMSAEEFPKMPSLNDYKFSTMGAQNLKSSIDKTSFAISTDEMRYNLNGAYVETVKGEKGKTAMRMVATDGHRLAMVTRDLGDEETLQLKKGVILPRKGIAELKKLLSEGEGKSIEVGFSDSNAAFRLGESILQMRLVVGEFPDYQGVVPKNNKKKMVVNREVFANSLRRVSILSEGKSKCVKLAIKGNGLHLSAASPELGEAEEDLPGEFDGGELDIGFNARYLLDVLSVTGGDKVLAELEHEQSPGIFRSPDDATFIGVVMPMRI